MNADDPKFTAHILGESDDITPAERAEIEALLAGDPTAAAEAAEIRILVARLQADLPGEAAAGLEEKQRAAVFEAARRPAPVAKVVQFPRRATLLALSAACAVVGISVGLIYQAMQMPTSVSISPLAVDSGAGNLSSDPAGMAGHEPPLQSIGAGGAPLIATAYADAGILKMVGFHPGVGRGMEPHVSAIADADADGAAGATMISTGAVSVNGGGSAFSNSTVTVGASPDLPTMKGAVGPTPADKGVFHEEFLEMVKKAKSPVQ